MEVMIFQKGHAPIPEVSLKEFTESYNEILDRLNFGDTLPEYFDTLLTLSDALVHKTEDGSIFRDDYNDANKLLQYIVTLPECSEFLEKKIVELISEVNSGIKTKLVEDAAFELKSIYSMIDLVIRYADPSMIDNASMFKKLNYIENTNIRENLWVNTWAPSFNPIDNIVDAKELAFKSRLRILGQKDELIKVNIEKYFRFGIENDEAWLHTSQFLRKGMYAGLEVERDREDRKSRFILIVEGLVREYNKNGSSHLLKRAQQTLKFLEETDTY